MRPKRGSAGALETAPSWKTMGSEVAMLAEVWFVICVKRVVAEKLGVVVWEGDVNVEKDVEDEVVVG